MKSILPIIYLVALFFHASAQQKTYEGEAIWLPMPDATEKFRYLASDSTMTPIGEYTWRLNSEHNASGLFELAQIKTNFRNKVADGEFEFLHFTLNFNIEDFDQLGIKSSIIGNKTIVKGRYNRGLPSGQWSFVYAPYNTADEKSWPALIYNAAQRKWNYQSDTISIVGRVDEKGFFDGRWEFKFIDDHPQLQEYQKGILTALFSNGKLQHQELWPNVLKYIKETETSIPNNQENPFIWQAGFSHDDSIYIDQIKPASALNNVLIPHKIVQSFLNSHPLLSVPVMAGTQRLKFNLTIDEEESLRLNAQRLLSNDSLLRQKMQQPVFQIRKLSNPQIDSLLRITEGFIVNTIRQYQSIKLFLKEESRYKSPEYILPESGKFFSSHTEISNYLNKQVDTLLTKIDRHRLDLLDAIEYLRIKGAIADMESEWYYLKEEIDNLIPTDNLQTFPLIIYNRFVDKDFNERIEEFSKINTYEERRQFLIDAINYYEYFNNFFKSKDYLKLTEVREEFITHYTRYLYNPYMGINNVEVLVKKKFILHMLNNFWPYILGKLEQAQDGDQFIELYIKVCQYKKALLYLADDHAAEAKRLERRGRKELNMNELETLISDYTIYWQSISKD